MASMCIESQLFNSHFGEEFRSGGDSMLNGEDAHVNGDILNSWKEIAGYLDRGIRTVQRWERELHLPIRRPRGRRRSAVLAIRREIDAWLGSLPQNSLEEPTPTNQHMISETPSRAATLVSPVS